MKHNELDISKLAEKIPQAINQAFSEIDTLTEKVLDPTETLDGLLNCFSSVYTLLAQTLLKAKYTLNLRDDQVRYLNKALQRMVYVEVSRASDFSLDIFESLTGEQFPLERNVFQHLQEMQPASELIN